MFLIETPDGKMSSSMRDKERSWQAECLRLATGGTTAAFEAGEEGIWELRVTGPDAELTHQSCKTLVDAYLANDDPEIRRIVLVASSQGVLIH